MSAPAAPYAGRMRARALRASVPLIASALCAAVLLPAAALAAPTATTSYTSPGVYGFTVPAGISSISVTTIGAAGGTGCGSTSGEGASVSATLPVAPGELFEVALARQEKPRAGVVALHTSAAARAVAATAAKDSTQASSVAEAAAPQLSRPAARALDSNLDPS